jgi:hypothetical protein
MAYPRDAQSNRRRVQEWVQVVADASHETGADDEYLSSHYHLLYRPDAPLLVPGDTKMSGYFVGFAGWQELHRKTAAASEGDFHLEIEEMLATDNLCVTIVRLSGKNSKAVLNTRATELRWFDEEGFVHYGEFMARDWDAVSLFFS